MGPRIRALALPRKRRHHVRGRFEDSTTASSRLEKGQHLSFARELRRRCAAVAGGASSTGRLSAATGRIGFTGWSPVNSSSTKMLDTFDNQAAINRPAKSVLGGLL